MKIATVGYSGSGKSTTATKLGAIYNIPVLHLDTVQFMENWQERPPADSQRIVADFMTENDSWVIDGNYKAFYQQQRLEQADMIIFFNFNRFVCLARVLKRFIKFRNRTRPSMAAGCDEKLDFRFVKWILHDGRTAAYKKHYADICKTHSKKVVIIKNQRQLDDFLRRQGKS